jgi:hypothetical protein
VSCAFAAGAIRSLQGTCHSERITGYTEVDYYTSSREYILNILAIVATKFACRITARGIPSLSFHFN